ncbi:hypothetical protein B1B_18115, partial [mine drainage metagenome]
YEKALVVKRLANNGHTPTEISRRLGMTATQIGNLVVLAGAPRPIVNWVIAGDVSASTAIEVLKEHGSEAVAVLEAAFNKAKSEGKQKVKPQQIAGKSSYTRVLRKHATALYEVTRNVRSDPAYAHLSEDTREQIDQLIQELEKCQSHDAQTG